MGLEFGLALDFGTRDRPLHEHLDRQVHLIQLAEQHGFASVWVGEEYAGALRLGHLPASHLVVAALARGTSLMIGTSVMLLPMRSPLMLAFETALLDCLTNGRFLLGVGVGQPPLWQKAGMERARVGPFADEMLAMLRALWSGQARFRGREIDVEGPIWPLPVRPGGPPIWVGGYLRRSAERAARLGDGYYASTSHPLPLLAPQFQRYREALAATGKDPTVGVTAVNRLTVVAPSEAEAKRIAERHVGAILRVYATLGTFGPDLHRDVPGTAELFRQQDRSLCLVGTPDQVARRIAEYERAGATHLQLRVSSGDMPFDLAAQSIELVGREIIPSFVGSRRES